ncbi:MAG: PRC-barrel domain-containing protein [Bradyrhizobium sp.]
MLFASVALAETPTTSDRAAAAAPASEASLHGDWRTSKVVGLSVYDNANENVASINDLLIDKSGNVKAAVLSVGGVLGVGARLVALPFDQVKFVDEPVPSTTASSAPASADRPGSTATTGSASTTTGSTSTSSSMTASKPNPWYPDHAVINATKDQLQAMPEFKFTTE